MRIPKVILVSSVTCDYTQCERREEIQRDCIGKSLIERLYIRAAGYSPIDNLVYLDVFLCSNKHVIHTVECIPRRNQQGIVKLVVKSQWNDVACTAVQFPEDILAFYSRDRNLLGYQWKNIIFDYRNKEVMHIEKAYKTYKAKYQQKPSLQVKFNILDNTNSLVAIIAKEFDCMHIYRSEKRLEISLSFLEIVFAIPLAVNMHSAAYKMDEWPIPEITYQYRKIQPLLKIEF